MVAFPDLANKPTLHNINELQPNNQINCNDKLPNGINGIANNGDTVVDLPHIMIASDQDNYTLGFNNMQKGLETTKLDLSTSQFNAEPDIVKKVAVALKMPDSMNSEKGPPAMDNTLSSGSSIVTVSSIANSEPDPEFPNNGANPHKGRKLITDEPWYHTTLQVSVPFFIAGAGTIGAGLVLDKVQNWSVFEEISQLFILVPALLGLKGNLDMCLASRLSTQANLGNMISCREITKMIIGNLALVQIQAIVAATLVALFAVAVAAITDGRFSWNHSVLLIVSSIFTATSSCFILDFAMIAIIMFSHRCKMNPDNLATPLAASIGDVVSLSVLSGIASQLFLLLENQIWILYTIICVYFVLLPIWICIVLKNKYTRNVLTSGWIPVLSALFISGLGGLILDNVVDRLNGFVIFSPIINGIGGNLVSVQASRISTMLHQTSIMGILPPHAKMCISPFKALIKGALSAKTAKILIGMSIPGHLVFMFAADYVKQGQSTLHLYFVLCYLFMAVLQVILLLYAAHIIIHAMWKYKIDPDNSAIPYLTALGDLTGTMFLAAAFWFLYEIGYAYGEVKSD